MANNTKLTGRIGGKIEKVLRHILTATMVPFFSILPKGLLNALSFIYEQTYVGLWRAKYFRPALLPQRVNNVDFSLWIIGQHPGAQMAYDSIKSAEREESYEVLMVECLTRILNSSQQPVFIDVGAFMGYYACYVSGYLKDRLPVYAIESNPDYCGFINRSAKENNFKNLKVFPAVLSDKEEILSVYKETVTADDARGKKISTVTLDRLAENENIKPTVLKIDVHGAEGKVIGGAKKILKDSVKFALFELHPDDYLKKYSPGWSRQDILAALEECGFKNYLVGGFRYPRSQERLFFQETGKISCMEINPDNKDTLFFDRYSDLFIFAVKKGCDITSFNCHVR